ncbi:type I-E CRISPR-associated protein Cse2/CasB [Marinactinospora thermotolerans]|uniref:CRISPR-associated protein, Cse2 family n=1 Tax=Marinactinospora thermotolerans DSM 45154 TaxID=1122192 RepID=A0A1T4QF94_9ACTN|nr:type I-E CRISPR-associated protein Cse2/CasB [Marinactinospora thermotolerans]SKA02402.1 CRISPR-associated protein, Cse2 family [Marinactinospora thermotolerans DSM 45154]
MTATTTERKPALRPLGAYVDEQVRKLQEGYLRDRPGAVATLAGLRGGAGKPLTDAPEAWEFTSAPQLHDALPYGGDPEGERRREAAENAVHMALSLYAVHQQSRREERMHRPGPDLGRAVRRLMPPGDIDQALHRRFVQAGTAVDPAVLAQRLREIVTLLRRESIPLDYGLLADHLHTALAERNGIKQVRTAWGRGFHAYRPANEPADTGTNDDTDKDAA